MTTIKVMLNTDRKVESGYYPLVIRLIHKRKKRMIYTSFKFKEEDFDADKEQVLWCKTSRYSAQQVLEVNRYLSDEKQQYEQVIHRLHLYSDKPFTVDDIVAKCQHNQKFHYLFEYIDREVEGKNKSQRYGTSILYRTTKESIRRFTEGRDVLLSKVSFLFVSNYVDYLREMGVRENTIHMYLRNFRALYNKARKEGIIQNDHSPFEYVKMGGTKTSKRAITKEMIRQIARMILPADSELDRVRDVFMFSFYSRGMSLVDVLHLKHTDVRHGVIYYTRCKTKQIFQVAITPPLQAIIDKYHSNSTYIFPYLHEVDSDLVYTRYRSTLTDINRKLKVIGDLLDLCTPLTTYVARHSWATIAKSEGATIAAISEGLGHTTEKTTKIYLRAFDQSVIDEVNAKVVQL